LSWLGRGGHAMMTSMRPLLPDAMSPINDDVSGIQARMMTTWPRLTDVAYPIIDDGGGRCSTIVLC
jgi:hypothetical protein